MTGVALYPGENNIPIVPIRFTGGLPVEPAKEKLEFAPGLAPQDIWIGRPILPQTLQALPYGAQKQAVLDAINGLGPNAATETPNAPRPELVAAVEAHEQQTGVRRAYAVMAEVLKQHAACTESKRVLAGPIEGDDTIAQWLACSVSASSGRVKMTPHAFRTDLLRRYRPSGLVYHANYLRHMERAREHLIGPDELVRLYNEEGVGLWSTKPR